MTIEAELRLRKGPFQLDARFTAPGRGVTVVFGPSGCGKTSLLRAVAGLETAATGRVVVNGKTWQDGSVSVPLHQRPLGCVFQDSALFPHLSVRGNLEFGARRRRSGLANVEQVVDLLGLRELLQRKSHELSGGERQRVALGRALLSRPDLLLLDEPLSALDTGAKSILMPFLERALHLLEIPAVYVTHSVDELARLADHVILMSDGRVVASGSLRDSTDSLDGPLVRLEEAFSVLKGVIGEESFPGLSCVRTASGILIHLPLTSRHEGDQVRLRIPARDVSLTLEKTQNSSILNILPAVVDAISEAEKSGSVTIRLDLGGESLLARISAYSCGQLELSPGKQVFAQIKAAALLF